MLAPQIEVLKPRNGKRPYGQMTSRERQPNGKIFVLLCRVVPQAEHTFSKFVH